MSQPLPYRNPEPSRGASVFAWLSIGLPLASLGFLPVLFRLHSFRPTGARAIISATVTGIILGIVDRYLQKSDPRFPWIGIALNLSILLWLKFR